MLTAVLTDRRGFLRWTAGGAALLLSQPARGAQPAGALAIHRATRNTRLGAIGSAVRSGLQADLPPFKAYADLPRESLEMPTWKAGRGLFGLAPDLRPARAFEPVPCSRDQLARLLFLANGITDRSGSRPLRAAPSAGALYAGELYLVVERVTGADPGVYYYDVSAHALVRLRAGSLLGEVARAIESGPGAPRAAAAVLVTNVFARYRTRYANRGDRYALIDTGHIGENLRLAAGELGLGEASPARFAGKPLAALLGVDGRDEAVCAVHWIGKPAGPAQRSEVTAPGMHVHDAIRTRRSTRRFEPREFARADLLAILALARGHAALHRSAKLDLYVVAHRVADTAAGVHRYEPEARRLTLVRRGQLEGALVRACLGQKQTGAAAAALVGVARLSERDDAHDYRDVLLDAGATAQRIYLGAEALGLTARNLAAYYDDELDALLGLDGKRQVAVHLTAVGAGD
jgi:SagB-type dehydrogenase family enzyme